MTIRYRAYITTFRPSKTDSTDSEFLKKFGGRFSFGVHVFLGDRELGYADSWVKSKEAQYAEMVALAGLLTSLEEVEAESFELILNSEHLHTRLRQILARLRKKQRGESVSPIKKERQWEETAQRLETFAYGMREKHTSDESAAIGQIKSRLREEFYNGTRFTEETPPDFNLELTDG